MGLLDFAHHEHIDSWYHHTASGPTFAPLHDALDADVCVVGGGYTGLSAALELAERGLNVVLLEGARLGAHAVHAAGNIGEHLAGRRPGATAARCSPTSPVAWTACAPSWVPTPPAPSGT